MASFLTSARIVGPLEATPRRNRVKEQHHPTDIPTASKLNRHVQRWLQRSEVLSRKQCHDWRHNHVLGCPNAAEQGDLQIRLLFASISVDDFVAAKAPNFNKNQQTSTSRLQQVQQQSLWKPQDSTGFNRLLNLVRDQGVGGSNPLSPTNCFQLLTAAAGTRKPTHMVLHQEL